MISATSATKRDPIRPWFEALEALDEFIGIRFGRIPPDNEEVDWIYVPHSDFDGVGAFGHMIRQAGHPLRKLPQISKRASAARNSWIPFLRSTPKLLGARHRLGWRPLEEGPPLENSGQSSPSAAWHVFTEEETQALLARSREEGVTLNSLLMTQLDRAVRPDLQNPQAVTPWMIPVNIRGVVRRSPDTANHTSYVAINIRSSDGFQGVEQHIHGALQRGEHWGAWKGYGATQFLPSLAKRQIIRKDRVLSQWNIGGFSNLGVWDPECEVTHRDLTGSWLFCPPVLRCQMIGAGCVTFQNRLSLLLQIHPELSTSPEVSRRWMRNWLAFLEMPAKDGAAAGVGAVSASQSSSPMPAIHS